MNILKDKVTILIPTFNRPNYLLRILRFYQSYRLNLTIIVLDSSDQNSTNKALQKILTDDNIHYHHFDSGISFVEKLITGIALVNTPYMVFCADDDFIFPEAVSECIAFLEDHPDYVMAHGFYILHSLIKNKLNWAVPYPKMTSLAFDSTIDRMTDYLAKQSTPVLYAVTRTDIGKLIYNETIKYANHWMVWDLFSAVLFLLYGKVKKIPILYASRQLNDYIWITHKRLENAYTPDKVKVFTHGLAHNMKRLNIYTEDNMQQIEHTMEIFVQKIKAQKVFPKSSILGSIFDMLGMKLFIINVLQFFNHPRYKERKHILKSAHFKTRMSLLEQYITEEYIDELIAVRKRYHE